MAAATRVDVQTSFLSRKRVLIQSVILSIPSYVMSCFVIPDSVLSELESMAAKIFWDQDCNRKIHWVAWSALCKSKEDVGLGFKQLRFQNMALLSKQAWRLAVNPQGLAHQVVRAKYFPNSNFLSAQIGSNPSFTWLSIL
ncbi:UNVERIFIED_CONTAM: putative mitochondrial protein [Sesamum angustifolium]|uniref:Mitochondrial protein n=1 Tax=Sesamum angustifolium TaxID=2727405 RepID=A0AAW2MMB3_9LAMI